MKNALPLVDRKIDISQYKKAEGTAIQGNTAMEYIVPLRTERQHPAVRISKKKAPIAPPDIFEATAVGDLQNAALLEFFINGRQISVSDSDIAELVELYTVDTADLEAYLKDI